MPRKPALPVLGPADHPADTTVLLLRPSEHRDQLRAWLTRCEFVVCERIGNSGLAGLDYWVPDIVLVDLQWCPMAEMKTFLKALERATIRVDGPVILIAANQAEKRAIREAAQGIANASVVCRSTIVYRHWPSPRPTTVPAHGVMLLLASIAT